MKNHREKKERTYQRAHAQNHAYANKIRRTYVHDLCQLSKPAYICKKLWYQFVKKGYNLPEEKMGVIELCQSMLKGDGRKFLPRKWGIARNGD